MKRMWCVVLSCKRNGMNERTSQTRGKAKERKRVKVVVEEERGKG